ncbi:hypothetical protein NDU88_004550, partial [Pleurodeles waltl]
RPDSDVASFLEVNNAFNARGADNINGFQHDVVHVCKYSNAHIIRKDWLTELAGALDGTSQEEEDRSEEDVSAGSK